MFSKTYFQIIVYPERFFMNNIFKKSIEHRQIFDIDCQITTKIPKMSIKRLSGIFTYSSISK